jgi:uncharacterized protein
MSSVPPPPPNACHPVAAGDRAPGVDAVRGFAILGLIFANIAYFASATPYLEWIASPVVPTGASRWAAFLVEFFIAGKCVTLLTFLLGAGLAWQQQRAEAAGWRFRPLALRRMGALFVIGLLHAILLWWGDILCFYAILGASLLVVIGLSPRSRRLLALGLMVGCVLLLGGICALGLLAEAKPQGAAAGDFTNWVRQTIPFVERTYRQGSFLEILPLRAMEAAIWQSMLLLYAPFSFGLVLLGYDSVRTGWFPRDGRVASWGTPVMLAIGAAVLLLAGLNSFATVTWPQAPITPVIAAFLGIPASIATAGIYLLVLMRLACGPSRALLRPLADVGRTALSNYLLQSLLAGLVFYGYGAGLYGRLGPWMVLLVAVGIVLVQLVWTRWWLARFRFGPAEWLWRRATYGRPRPSTIPAP